MEWKYIGKLKSGVLVFKDKKGDLRVDRVLHVSRNLETPTVEERGQIYRELRR